MGAAVSVAALWMDGKRVFLGQRKNEGDMALRWELPGGKAEAGESPQAALQREILEELGFVPSAGALVTESHFVHHGKDHHLLVYRCPVSELPPVEDLAHNEHLGFAWWSADDILERRGELVDSDFEALRPLLGDLAG